MAPVLIHIGPDSPVDQALERLFRANGLAVDCHDRGRLAGDVTYAAGLGRAPLVFRPDARLVAGLFRHSPHWRPPLESFRHVAHLARHLPDARFLLTCPPEEAWALWRLSTPALACHAHQGVPPQDLPRIWRDALRDHIARVEDLLGGDPRLIRMDTERTRPADLVAALGADFGLHHCPDARWPAPDPAAGLAALMDRATDAPAAPADWAEDVARFCLRGLDPAAPGGTEGLSGFACHWDGRLAARGAVTDPKGQPRQIAVLTPPGSRPLALAREGRHFKLIRAEGVINDILSLDRRDPVWIDMEDSRWFGSPEGAALDRPVLCHNRRAGAVNAVLWPLPDQHAVGLPGFDPASPPDDIPWEEKEDRLIWRGMISGSEMRPGIRPGPASHVWLSRLAEAASPAEREAAWQGLCRTNRMDVIRRHAGQGDIDMGIVMAWAFRDFARDPLIAPYCRPRMGPRDFRRFRYQLCMTGYDHGSNFISGLDTNGVLLAEEDGWQVFYSGRFQPWRHYIPLARHCTDLREKLDWARANPGECRAISARARAEAAHLRDPEARRALMRLILDGLAAAR
ncbi:hypothetical protein D3P06_17310 [Paracoccus aestuarii]|uniref:Glycosyl transferase CAP10 domain-containing protein n=1 Tax=Paracoccus aestuarii TaxID=453842 RepID=A0A418ZQI9_9RHOB|nr:glycosyl transferase family 90 [Paracoccus aestuarii]RJK96656.1 hypothetical protein D3P06_17310 [Paracoccus aestuarii]WCQ99702.1 hypothetical protein JHW48_02880 [Paracoccus aestuarii]